MAKRIKLVILEPISDKGKEKLAHHGERWHLKDEIDNLKFVRSQGPSIVVRSRDGSKILFVKKTNDPDFKYRLL